MIQVHALVTTVIIQKYLSSLDQLIRQGCPISALLFLLVAEIIAIHKRSDKKIVAININNTEFKISLMADDTTLIWKNIESL